MTNEPQIYIADLAAYNNAILHGVWIDATSDIDEMQAQIQAMLKTSPIKNAEEYAIHDHSGFEGAPVSEWDGLEDVHALAIFIGEYDILGVEVLNHFGDIEAASKALDEAYHGQYASLADYAEQFTEDTTTIPQHLQHYIDYHRMGRDWEMSGDIVTVETAHNEVHVFSNC